MLIMDYEALEKGILELIEELKNTPGKELLTEYIEAGLELEPLEKDSFNEPLDSLFEEECYNPEMEVCYPNDLWCDSCDFVRKAA